MQKSNTIQMPELVSPACFGKSVLLIDPDEVSHVLHKYYLKKYKIKLQCTKSIRHALWLVQENVPDIILTEIYFNGQIEYRHLFLLLQECYIPIIVQTCQLSEKYQDISLVSGAEAYFTKPLDWKTYLRAIERCLVKST